LWLLLRLGGWLNWADHRDRRVDRSRCNDNIGHDYGRFDRLTLYRLRGLRRLHWANRCRLWNCLDRIGPMCLHQRNNLRGRLDRFAFHGLGGR
jgi:hypothetical protein